MNCLIGLILIFAAAFKALELFQNPAAFLQKEFTSPIIPFLIAGELGIGFLALYGVYWKQLRMVAMTLFTMFAGYSLYLALQGAESCGCFGSVKVNPWWTLGLDVVVVAGLVVEWWWEKPVEFSPSPKLSPGCGGEGLWKLFGVGVVSVALCLMLVWHTKPVVHADGLLQTVSGLTILEPEEWNGRPFPLKESIDADLSQGEWLVVLHRHDCHDCQKAMPLYEELAASGAGKRVALVEVPPFGEEDSSPQYLSKLVSPVPARREGEGLNLVVGRLTPGREWFVQTPVEIRIKDGVVVAASRELPGIHGTKAVAKLATVGH